MYKLKPSVFFIVIFMLVFMSTAFAAAKKTPDRIRIDTTKVQIKKFNPGALKKFSADKDFNYNGTATGEISIWERFWNWIWAKIIGFFRSVPYSGTLFKYLLLGLSVALLVYVVFKSLGIDPIQLIRGDAKRIAVPYSESLENIHEINFDSEIDKAVSLHNYRLAVRLLYLKCLKELSDKNLIRWQIDKTNTAYFYELTQPEQRQTFGLLTRQFEYVWYGDFAIDKDAFVNINGLFQNFKKQLA